MKFGMLEELRYNNTNNISNMTTFYTSTDFSTFNVNEFLKKYHYFEELDLNKQYDSNEFKIDYGKGQRNYMFFKYVISDMNDTNYKKIFMVAKEYPTHKELGKLAKYCTCEYHKARFFDKPHIDAFYYGCLSTGRGRARQDLIDEARRRIDVGERQNNSCTIL